ncbi:uncharacterized protein LOC126184190 [Schistocerca cancellata]|uniref:uncharacterized protein LOC126184190 n=1 Tax=Schistocerca cancellata TaxID=274614 RepID=UPI0021186370|nr:uncharacterized protein LOC126184190 [Schistocerca cancellata]
MCGSARNVLAALRQNCFLIFPLIGSLCSFLVFIEMIQKLSFPSETNWSPLRLLGPATWLPLITDTGKLVAVQTMIHSILYFIACYYLIQGISQRTDALMAPWYMMHSFFFTYQMILILVFENDYNSAQNIVAAGNAF